MTKSHNLNTIWSKLVGFFCYNMKNRIRLMLKFVIHIEFRGNRENIFFIYVGGSGFSSLIPPVKFFMQFFSLPLSPNSLQTNRKISIFGTMCAKLVLALFANSSTSLNVYYYFILLFLVTSYLFEQGFA